MSAQLLQPVRVSEILGITKSSDKRLLSDRKRHEPVKIKELLASCSKSALPGEESKFRTQFSTSNNTRKSVRRALYTKATPTKQTPNKNNVAESSAVKISAKKTTTRSKRSLLPQPNSIAQKHIRKIIDEGTRQSTIIEERYSQVHETSEEKYERPTVIKNAKLQNVQQQEIKKINPTKTSTIPTSFRDQYQEIESLKREELDVTIADKENIPPPPNQIQSTIENKSQSENINLHIVSLCLNLITRVEKLEHALEEVKITQKEHSDLLRTIYDAITNKSDMAPAPSITSNISSSEKILTEAKSPLDAPGVDKENIPSEKKKRQSKGIVKERRRSARLAEKLSANKLDSFEILEDELSIRKLTLSESPLIQTPENKRQNINSKSDRPLREYLAMKASMSFLETPQPNGFKGKNNLNDNDTPSQVKTMRRSISSKLFDELQDLYHDSPPSSNISGKNSL